MSRRLLRGSPLLALCLVALLALLAGVASTDGVIRLDLQQSSEFVSHGLDLSRFEPFMKSREAFGTDEYLEASAENHLIFHGFSDVFTMPISLGTPPQSFNVLLDTGSNALWVASSRVRILSSWWWGKSCFKGKSSSTYKGSNTMTSIRYVSGEIRGYEASDMVGADNVPHAVPINFLEIVEAGSMMLFAPFDGIAGMNKNQRDAHKPLWRALWENKQISRGSFAMDFDPNNPSIMFGDVEDCYRQNIKYHPLVPIHNNEDFFVLDGRLSVDHYAAPAMNYIFDTGTNRIVLPLSVFNLFSVAINSHALTQELCQHLVLISIQKLIDLVLHSVTPESVCTDLGLCPKLLVCWTCKQAVSRFLTQEGLEALLEPAFSNICAPVSLDLVRVLERNQLSTAPKIRFLFGDEEYALTPSEYTVCFEGWDYCLIMVVGIDLNGVAILGTPFLTRHYVDYRPIDKQIGLARMS